ncbi:MAG: hypothetical protein QG572_1347 [Pseudomonadota bacterium]|jgi:hypothetical protein|nr:hypothetical protein [Pseudomonadota bacterium]
MAHVPKWVIGIDSGVADQLTKTWLVGPSAFWENVQEPSKRVADKVLLAKLAALALTRFDDRFVRSAAVVNLLYRTTEPEWVPVVDVDVLPDLANQFRAELQPADSFTDCRWFLSLLLGEAAFWMSRGRSDQATLVLQQAEPVRELAFRYGQLYTNVVKALLLRLVAGTRDGFFSDGRDALCQAVDRTIAMAGQVPQHYIFSNEWAFEEVAYVYTMIRQIYNWRRLSGLQERGLPAMEQAGFAWRCVGNPFRALA